jgi:hypothetical protein
VCTICGTELAVCQKVFEHEKEPQERLVMWNTRPNCPHSQTWPNLNVRVKWTKERGEFDEAQKLAKAYLKAQRG